MSGYRKRRTSDSSECSRKRMSFERYDFDSYIKKESHSHGSKNYNCKPQRHYNDKYVARNTSSNMGNALSRNYNSGNDNGSQLNFKHDVYINSLRQSEKRHVDYYNLRRRLLDIDIRYLRNRKFYTAFDLTQELESSLKYFVDTRNELVFLRKLQRPQCVPFSYNGIHIENRKGLQNRILFLENESAFRSHRMNQLFRQLQCVVIPSLIDDIRHVHSVSYERSWADGKRYWFSLFKDIKWEKSSRDTIRSLHRYLPSKHQRCYRSHDIKEDNVNIKSEVVIMPKVEANTCKVGISDATILQALAEIREISKSIENSNFRTQQSRIDKQDELGDTLSAEDLNVETNDTVEVASVKVEKFDDTLSQALSDIRELSKSIEKRKAKLFADLRFDFSLNLDADKDDVDDVSGFCEIKESNISVVTVTDDDLDSSINVSPPEGDTKN